MLFLYPLDNNFELSVSRQRSELSLSPSLYTERKKQAEIA